MMTTRKPRNAAVYCRISRDRDGQALGVARQEKDCAEWAARHGWTVTSTLVDDDLSAYSGRARPGYRRLLADIEAGRTDGLVIWHPDRLHRRPAELESFIDLVERTGLPIGSVQSGEVDLTTPTGRMSARIVGAVARHESEHKAAPQARKHREFGRGGLAVRGRVATLRLRGRQGHGARRRGRAHMPGGRSAARR